MWYVQLAIVLLWCSSSLSRPESTRASYSAIGPWAVSESDESALHQHLLSGSIPPTYMPALPVRILWRSVLAPVQRTVEQLLYDWRIQPGLALLFPSSAHNPYI